MAEVAGQRALVGEARGIGNVRQREIGLRQHLLGALEPLLREVVVRRDAGGLLELPREMMHRQPGDGSQHRQIDAFAEVQIDEFPDPAHRACRQSTLRVRCRRQLQEGADRVQARARMQSAVPRTERSAHGVLRRRHEGWAALAAAGEEQLRIGIGLVLAPKEVGVPLEDRPQADAGVEPVIIEHEGPARDPAGPDNPLAGVDRQQHAGSAAVERRDRDDPLPTMLLAKESLFYGAPRLHRQGTRQRVCPLRELGIDRRYVQNGHQLSIGAEHRRAGTAQVYVPRSEMLASVHIDRALLGDAGANAVRPLRLLGPHAAEPGSPIFETARLVLLATVLDGDARAVAQQDDVSGFADHLIQLIDLVLGAEDELVERVARLFQLARRQDARRPAIGRIDSISTCRSLPGARDLPYRERRPRAFDDRIGLLGMAREGIERPCGARRHSRHPAWSIMDNSSCPIRTCARKVPGLAGHDHRQLVYRQERRPAIRCRGAGRGRPGMRWPPGEGSLRIPDGPAYKTAKASSPDQARPRGA